MSAWLVVIGFVAFASLLCAAWNRRLLPSALRGRGCQGSSWRRVFPNVPKQDIRSFLSVFVEAFALSGSQRLKLNPNDNILGIYRARNPHQWQPDSLELEALDIALKREYRIELSTVWRKALTLGQLFAHVRKVKVTHRPE